VWLGWEIWHSPATPCMPLVMCEVRGWEADKGMQILEVMTHRYTSKILPSTSVVIKARLHMADFFLPLQSYRCSLFIVPCSVFIYFKFKQIQIQVEK
jgi:hypothetical protein